METRMPKKIARVTAGTCQQPGCERVQERRTYCVSHYRGALRRREIAALTIRERFESKVDRSGGPNACHPWIAGLTSTGYGQFNGGDGLKAHRYAYRWDVGPLDPDELVRHTCDNPPCVNPLHLVKGSQKDNVTDCVERGRFKIVPMETVRGVRNVNAKLTPALVRQLRVDYARGDVSITNLARRYGIAQSSASSVLRRKTWSHVA